MEKQIEGRHRDVIIVSSAEMRRVEVEQSEGVEGGHLPVDDAGPCRDSRNGVSQRTKARGAVVSALVVEPHKAAVLVQLDAPAVVQPVGITGGVGRNTGVAGAIIWSKRMIQTHAQ